jgi:hypothetical protein
LLPQILVDQCNPSIKSLFGFLVERSAVEQPPVFKAIVSQWCHNTKSGDPKAFEPNLMGVNTLDENVFLGFGLLERRQVSA